MNLRKCFLIALLLLASSVLVAQSDVVSTARANRNNALDGSILTLKPAMELLRAAVPGDSTEITKRTTFSVVEKTRPITVNTSSASGGIDPLWKMLATIEPTGSDQRSFDLTAKHSETMHLTGTWQRVALPPVFGNDISLDSWQVLSLGPTKATSGNATTLDYGTQLSVTSWRVAGEKGHLFCEVRYAKSDSAQMRVLTISRQEGPNLIKIFSFATPDTLLSMYPLGEYNGRLFTTWVAGSAYHLRAWAFVEGQAKLVLDEGTRILPEFLYDDQGRELILITDPVMRNGKWITADGTTRVFKWNSETYDKIGTVSWMKRLQCLSRDACASLK